MPSNGVWTEQNVIKFLMLTVYASGSPTKAQFTAIAEKMGIGFTQNALYCKWQRLKAQVEKEGGLTVTGGPSSGTVKQVGKAGKAADDDGDEKPKGSKRKTTGDAASVKKTKKAKQEPAAEPADTDEADLDDVKEEIHDEV